MRSALLLALLCALSNGSVVKDRSSSPGLELIILHNNDMHAHFEQTSQLSGVCTTEDREAGKCYGGFPRVAHVVKEHRAAAAAGGPPVLYLNAGDTYTGTAWFTLYKWRIAADFINALQPDAVSLGNHEFDNQIDGLSPFLRNITTPVLAANVMVDKEPLLFNVTNLKKSITLNKNGVNIGVIGYLTPYTRFLAMKSQVEFIDEIQAIQEEVDKLQSEGVNIIIALGHSGYLKDIEIAQKVIGIDLVIGGHSHTFLWNGTAPDSESPQGPYPTIVYQASGKGVPVVQAYAFTKYIGKLHLQFDGNGEILGFSGEPILLNDSVRQDPDVLTLVDIYRTKLSFLDEVVGNTSVSLDGSCRLRECNMGNLITDATVEYYADLYEGEHRTDAPVAILHGGRVRISIPHITEPTPLTHGDLITVLPFNSVLVVVTMNGSTLREALEDAVYYWRPVAPTGQFLQVSGIKVVYDLAKSSGHRVVTAQARCGQCDIPEFLDIENGKTYKVIMPEFLAQGGDGFGLFVNLPRVNLNYSELTCVIEYIKKHSPIAPILTGRIMLLNESTLTNHFFATNASILY